MILELCLQRHIYFLLVSILILVPVYGITHYLHTINAFWYSFAVALYCSLCYGAFIIFESAQLRSQTYCEPVGECRKKFDDLLARTPIKNKIFWKMTKEEKKLINEAI